jgi:hypothetical protein
MKTPIFRVPTRDAHDADHMAIIALGGGIYLWFGRTGLLPTTLPWITTVSALSIISGILLWLRVPGAKWIGALVFIALGCSSVRHAWLHGWTMLTVLYILLPLICTFWMLRINYSHKFDPHTD